jgi:tetratricopeptide (TPR) repeat protein
LPAAGHNLEKLYELSLVQQRQPGRYQLHPLLRDYAREKIATNAPLARMAAHYNQVLHEARQLYEQGDAGVEQGLALFDLERANIQAGQSWAMAHAAEDREALRLCCDYPLSGGFLVHLRLHPQEIIRWCENGLAAARRLQKRADEGRHLVHLGITCHDLGQFHESLTYYQQALPIFQELHDRQNECNVFDKLGLTNTRLGQFKQAIAYHEQALSIAREIGDKQRESNALGNLGVAYKNVGEFKQSLKYQEQALAIARELGDFHGTGTSLHDLATLYLELNEAASLNRIVPTSLASHSSDWRSSNRK